MITGSELSQLNAILTRLEALNQQLRGELASSKESLRLLEEELSALRNELGMLKAALSKSRTSLARSEEELMLLREQLLKAENSLTRLEQSFGEYKAAAESRIRALTRQRNLAIAIAVMALLM